MPRTLIAALLVLASLPLLAAAQSADALINEQLDKLADLELKGPLPASLQAINRHTGVRIEADSSVWDALPWGQQTPLEATIRNQSLRASLDVLTRKLALRWELGEQAVILRPMPALRRIGRRSTVQELEAIDLLASTPAGLNEAAPTLRALVEAVDLKLLELKSPYAVEYRAAGIDADARVNVGRNATLLGAMEAIAEQTRATWYPWGRSIVVISKPDHVRTALNRPIDARYNRVDLAQVLLDLGRRSGVTFTIEPGAVQRIAPEFRTVKLELESATILQALESIAGFTGLSYTITDTGVYVFNGNTRTGSGGPRDPMVGLLTVPGTNLQLVVPSSEMPADVREFLEAKRAEQIRLLRQQMEREGFRPSTRPAE